MEWLPWVMGIVGSMVLASIGTQIADKKRVKKNQNELLLRMGEAEKLGDELEADMKMVKKAQVESIVAAKRNNTDTASLDKLTRKHEVDIAVLNSKFPLDISVVKVSAGAKVVTTGKQTERITTGS